jgi:hypothetical protein
LVCKHLNRLGTLPLKRELLAIKSANIPL